MWKKCPLQYKYSYVDKLSSNLKSIHLAFGSSMHDTIQCYLYTEYNKKKLKGVEVNGIPVDDYVIRDGKKIIDFDTSKLLQERMYKEVQKLSDSEKDDSITLENMKEFYADGVAICDYLKKKRSDWFFIRGWELIDIEMKLEEDIKENLYFVGYIDILLKDKLGNYHIIDLKTSTGGWRDYHKKDKTLTNQNLLYKHFLSKKLNIPLEQIKVEYLVLKRKVPDDPEYAIMGRRLQRFIPSDGKVSMNKAVADFEYFVENVFDDDGNRKEEGYEPTPSKNACRFCEYNERNICNYAIK